MNKSALARARNRALPAMVFMGLLTLAVSCQLNDTDSAPPAPVDDTERSASAAQAGAASAGQGAPRVDAGASLDAGSQTAPEAGAFDGGDASPTPGFPGLPSLEAGVLPPGNFGSLSDASPFFNDG